MNEMKPCPICKREHEIDIDAEFGGVMFRHKNFDWNKDQCLLAEQELSENVSVDRFVEIWNSRPIEDQLKSENERLQIEKVYFEELADKWSKQYYKDCDQLKAENEKLAKENELMVETIKSLIASKNKLEDAYEYAKNNILLIYETATRLKGANKP